MTARAPDCDQMVAFCIFFFIVIGQIRYDRKRSRTERGGGGGGRLGKVLGRDSNTNISVAYVKPQTANETKHNETALLVWTQRKWREYWGNHGWFSCWSKIKDRFLNQRWTCWYSCEKKHASTVNESQFSFTFLFVFILKSLSLRFTSLYAMEAFFYNLVFYLIPQCLLNVL